MAVLALSHDRADLRSRLDALVPAWDSEGKPVTAGQLGAAGAMAVLLRSAIEPNLLQTTEGTPALIHAGPFGNLSIGASSILADRFALPRVDFLVTEAGFGADLGAEKFFHLKCGISGEQPDAAVVVTTLRSLREHGGVKSHDPDAAAVARGVGNLRHHVEVMVAFGAPVVVAINRFPEDSLDELAIVKGAAIEAGAAAVAEHQAYTHGGDGCLELAEMVAAAADTADRSRGIRRLYELTDSCQDKVLALATTVYGAADVVWEAAALRALERFTDAGYGLLPVCMAKTHLSLSHDPTLLGVPTGFTLPVREIRLAAGAGYLTVLTGTIATMPGLPARPRLLDIDVDGNGTIIGLT
jgi:formyltetrahydrofolate synthetase